jgi:hypothetical protein
MQVLALLYLHWPNLSSCYYWLTWQLPEQRIPYDDERKSYSLHVWRQSFWQMLSSTLISNEIGHSHKWQVEYYLISFSISMLRPFWPSILRLEWLFWLTLSFDSPRSYWSHNFNIFYLFYLFYLIFWSILFHFWEIWLIPLGAYFERPLKILQNIHSVINVQFNHWSRKGIGIRGNML